MQREYIEKILQLNGIDTSSPDDQIKSVLLSARWHKDDVDTAILVLREDTETHESHVDSVRKVFHSDERLRPETVRSLLGVDMDVSGEKIKPGKRKNMRGLSFVQFMEIVVLAGILSVAVITFMMWHSHIGMFQNFTV